MGKRKKYSPGTFCWVELATTDVAAAKSFYGELFGWEADDMPVGEGGSYTMLRLDGNDVCAMYQMGPNQPGGGMPPHWFSYVSVEDANATLDRARNLGGSVRDAFDVMDAGRMAVIQDPTGAMLGAWQPKEHFGAARVNEAGALAWNELSTNDPQKASEFYGKLFEWSFQPLDMGGGQTYWLIKNSDNWRNGGVRAITPEQEGLQPNWLVYFGVESCNDSVLRARELRANVHVPPTDIPAGRIAVLMDPQGAAFALFEGEMDD